MGHWAGTLHRVRDPAWHSIWGSAQGRRAPWEGSGSPPSHPSPCQSQHGLAARWGHSKCLLPVPLSTPAAHQALACHPHSCDSAIAGCPCGHSRSRSHPHAHLSTAAVLMPAPSKGAFDRKQNFFFFFPLWFLQLVYCRRGAGGAVSA